ncbi:MAG: Rpn family recombination-promoting nuclease/putative transposase [Alphaproteobacteria bacterium]
MNFDSITPQKDSFVEEDLKLQIADLLYTAQFQGKQGSQMGYLYLLVENTSAPYKTLPLRMQKYCLAILEQHLKAKKKGASPLPLPLIYPMIFYTGEKPYPYSTDFLDLFEDPELARRIYHAPCPLADLRTVPDEHLLKARHFGAMAFLAKHIRELELLPLLEQIVALPRNLEFDEETGYIRLMVSYLFEAGEVQDHDAFVRALTTNLQQGDTIMTIAEQLRKEGFEKGQSMGFEKGQLREKLETAKKLLVLEIDEDVVLRATGLSKQDLMALKQQ